MLRGPYPGTAWLMTPPGPPAGAALFDVDGTLLDTNYLHVTAWWEAFAAAGHAVSCYDIHRALGLPAEDLVSSLLGADDARVVDGHAQRWAEVRPRCRPHHRAADLLRECARRGLRVAWVTSGAEEDLEGFRAALDRDGRDWRDAVHEVIASPDVERGKPDPQGVLTALERLGVPPERAALIGDTTYDVRAARAAGVTPIALACGGIGVDELRASGADAVYGNPSELLRDLDSSPLGAWTGRNG